MSCSKQQQKQKQQQQQKQHQKQQKQQQGGAGGPEYAQYVYGSAGSQHSLSSDDNRIAMNDPAGWKGGKKNQKAKKGGIGFIDVAVPALLVGTAYAYSRSHRSKDKRVSRKARRTRRKN